MGELKNIAEIKNKQLRKEKVLCFGEGNFLRAFTAVVVQKLNDNAGFDGNVVMLQGVEKGMCDVINAQKGLYTVIERGAENGKAVERFSVIDSVSRCVNPYEDYCSFLAIAENPDLEFVVSNTTEFGICYDESEKACRNMYRNFPAKFTDFLFRRYKHFSGDISKGLVVLPCELIEHNGKKLKEYILRYAKEWKCEQSFVDWIESAVVFADTLVDRIVSGYPKAEAEQLCEKMGYTDNLPDVCEPFFLWVIETSDKRIKNIPFDKCGLDIIVTDDLQPYRTRKVRILNGAHTMSVLAGHLCGFETVEQLVKDKTFAKYFRAGIFGEIIPSFTGDNLEKYADEVIGRFFNPFLNHKLLSIALNSVSKFKARVLPSIKDYAEKFGKAPNVLSFSLAALYAFYKTAGDKVSDELSYLNEIAATDNISAFMKNKNLWGEDLTGIAGFQKAVVAHDKAITEKGVKKALEELVND